MQTIPDILKSKKFQALIIGLVIAFAREYAPGIDEQTITEVISLIIAYIVGQGIADHGKEAEKVRQSGTAL